MITLGESNEPLASVRALATRGTLRVTQHAAQEMAEEAISLDDALDAIATGVVLEDYPQHRRGACCLIGGTARGGRPVHVVCTTANPILVIITVYEPKPPKWPTPNRRQKTT